MPRALLGTQKKKAFQADTCRAVTHGQMGPNYGLCSPPASGTGLAQRRTVVLGHTLIPAKHELR